MQNAEPARKNRSLPHWVVVLVILLTGGFTVWAMSMTRFRGPSLAWDEAHEVVDGVWGEEHDPEGKSRPEPWGVPPSPSQQNGALPNLQSGAKQVAGMPGAPPIVGGVMPRHADRGVCSGCHSVLTALGAPIPTITSASNMPHEYRGVCSNCHQLGLASALPAGRAVAAIGSPPAVKPAQPNEAEWLGMEVTPSVSGVNVQGVEGLAARRGVLPNDVVSSINGFAIATITDFISVTQNGALQQATMIVLRGGQRLAFELAPSPQPVPATAATAFGTAPVLPKAQTPQEAQF